VIEYVTARRTTTTGIARTKSAPTRPRRPRGHACRRTPRRRPQPLCSPSSASLWSSSNANSPRPTLDATDLALDPACPIPGAIGLSTRSTLPSPLRNLAARRWGSRQLVGGPGEGQPGRPFQSGRKGESVSPITRDRSPRPPGSLPTGPAFGFLLAHVQLVP